uniref:Uncharacterized protein n=1 Tax=Cajanus cajan TaxID=3821 RepID=A0A151T8W4_CAJCA|nr:hypothetical protein KK1_018077 [Cajanus cajan]
MMDEDTLLITKREGSTLTLDLGLFEKDSYKFWTLTAILLLAFWSMFTGTVSFRWSSMLNTFSHDLHETLLDHLNILEIEERENMVCHVWDVYNNNHRIKLSWFWQQAFKVAYEDLTSDMVEVRDDAITKIANMSLRSFDLQLLTTTHSMVITFHPSS